MSAGSNSANIERKEKQIMAQVTTVDVTDEKGSATFPIKENEALSLVETIASQRIASVKNTNTIEDAFFDYDVENGKVIEEAIIKMAEEQTFVATGQPDLSPKDPALFVKYFNKWEQKQFATTLRRDDIRAVIAGNKGATAEGVAGEIMATLTAGEGFYDYGQMRAIIENPDVGEIGNDYLGGTPKNMKGVIYSVRKLFNVVKSTNTAGGIPCVQGVPVEDIRIAVDEDVLNLMDVVELANVFNLSKEELFGKLVVLPYDESYDGKHTILVYDRKALGRATRLYDYSQDIVGKGRYTNHYLTTERAYFYNSLFKAIRLDVSTAVASAKGEIITGE